MCSRVMLKYCRLEQAGYRFISKLQDTTLAGEAKEKAVEKAFAQLKEALKQYKQARGVTPSSELESELDKVSTELAKKN